MGPLDLESQVAVSYQVCAGNLTQVRTSLKDPVQLFLGGAPLAEQGCLASEPQGPPVCLPGAELQMPARALGRAVPPHALWSTSPRSPKSPDSPALLGLPTPSPTPPAGCC